ncbi:Transcription factor castor, partial [Armadillidium vulgare]
VTPGLASLSLQNGDSTPPTMVPTLGGVRDHLNKQSIDYSRYVKRYLSALECGSPACRELNHSKKEEMIRHFKWHKKRDESLQHGFMRYSPNDDCSDRFANCSHNRKQTHYHCLKMHANYHRKDSAIMQEGFQRFRASEDCNDISCSFSGQRTTHFHCIRSNCNFNFKNKADMEKHKTYHIKDEQLTKDGFKKFMKQEDCGYDACKLSKVANHIHCIRSECNYVLHSSGQIFAHKLACISNHQRKHERQEHEKAYRKYKLAQTMLGVSESHPTLNPLLHEALRPLGGLGAPMIGHFGGDSRNEDSSSPMGCGGSQGPSMLPATSGISRPGHAPFLMGSFPPPGLVDGQHPLARLLGVPPPAAHNLFPGAENNSNSTPTSSSSGPASPVDLSVSMNSTDERDWERFVRCYSRDESCRSSCELSGLEHWHCEECEALFHTRDSAKEHGKVHEQQVAITEENYFKILPGENSSSCPAECQIQDQAEHYHCNWDGCGEAILSSGDKPFRRLEHYRIHDFARRLPSGVSPGMGVGVASVTSVDAMFKRKRGRPPKNRIIELPVSSSNDSPQAIFTSFKLPKSSPPLPPSPMTGPNVPSNPLLGFIPPGMSPLSHLAHMGREIPSSGIMPGAPLPPPLALSAAKKRNMLPLSEPIVENPPQPQAELVDGFYLWDEGVFCSDQLCPHIGRRHFHCAHPRCLYVSLISESLSIHSDDFHENTRILEGFMFFDRNINCRMSSCQNNTINKHFHCTKCGYSFIRYQAMEAHNEKHQQEEDDDQTSHTLGPLSPIYLQKQRPDSPMDTPSNSCLSTPSEGSETPSKSQLVKSSGIFYPLSPFPSASQGASRSTSTTTTNSEPGALVTPIPPSTRPTTLPTYTLPVSGCLSITATRRSPGLPPPFSPVQQEIMDQDESEESNKKFDSPGIDTVNHSSEQTDANDLSVAPVLSPSNERSLGPDIIPEQENGSQSQFEQEISCGRPFCKLKKKEHFHCQICNQAFSEQDKLRSHIMKHMSGYTGSETTEIEIDDDDESDIKQEDNQENCEDKKFTSEELNREQAPFSPQSTTTSIIPSPVLIPGLSSSTSPRAVITSMSCPQPPPQFANPLIYSQAASFHGLPGPFGPHFGISSMFPGTLPRFLPPGPWPGMHPALAAMAHPHLMLPQVRPNGEMPQVPQSVSQCNVPSMSSVVGVQAGMTPPCERSPIMPNSLNTSPHLALLGKRLGPDDFNLQEAKKIRASHSIRMLKDEPVPEGYIRFRFNEDCQYPHCGYREHQTHFHCMRKDCGYSFCDKTRFVQHTARHERLDTLMGGDFHQYRSNVPCGRSECVYSSMIGQQQNKASHFHCLKCDFVCTDTNKVVAHRRQHQKRDSINAAGFEKFTPSQPCGVQSCTHNQKQTHYHCLKCQYSVLGLSQMSAHKFRHVE